MTPSTTLAAAQQSLASELAPAITTLLTRAETYISKLERKQNNLIARSELLSGRLEGASGEGGLRKKRSIERMIHKARPGSAGAKRGEDGGNEERVLRLKALRGKKERLGYAVERLQLQSQQRQRQLRMSVAGQGMDYRTE